MSYGFNVFSGMLDLIKKYDSSDFIDRSLMNGSFQETFDALVTSDGSIVTVSVEQSGGGDLTMQFSDGNTIIDCTPACTIDSNTGGITPGTDSVPITNYIYIPQATKVLTVSTTGFPTSAEHIKVTFLLLGSATYIQSDGAYINQNWNDHLAGTDNMGHLLHMAERSRRDGAYYFSGIAPNGTDDSANTSYFDYVSGTEVYIKTTSGVIYQMHRHSVAAKDTRTDDIHVVNWNGDAYHDIHDITDITADSQGVSLTNRFFNLTLWGVGNKTGEYAPLMINLPNGSYANQANAEGDVDGFDVLTMPREFNLDSSTGFLIARMTLKNTSGNWSHKSTVDLRGQTPATATGGASGTTTNFADNQFTIFDESDITKVMAFDVGTLISAGNTRTLQIPDLSGVIFLEENSIDKISDVDTTTNAPSRDEVLKWDGSNWVPAIYNATFEFTIATFTDNESTPQEIGSGNWKTAIGADLSFDMTYNNGPADSGFISIGGTGGVSWTGGNLILGSPFTTQIQNIDDTAYPGSKDTTIVFTLDVTAGGDNDTDTETVTFNNRIRWGKSATATNWSSAEIVALSGSVISSDHTRSTMSITGVGAGDYLIFACPANYSNLTSINFSYNGLIVNMEALEIISVTNASGFTENYDVYRSTLQNLGDHNLQSNESTAQNYFYYGGSTLQTGWSEAQVKALTDLKNPITNDTTQTWNEVTLGASEYFVFAYPSRLTDPTNWFDNSTGFQLALFVGSPDTVSITNAQGYTENYDVWASENILGPGPFTLRTT